MAHYALIDPNNIVVRVITGVDEDVVQTDLDGTQIGGSAEAWEAFYENQEWFSGLTCKRTSYNGKIRKRYAGIGYSYDPIADVFIAPRPFPSWKLDANHDWQPPKPKPEGFYNWDETTQEWISVES